MHNGRSRWWGQKGHYGAKITKVCGCPRTQGSPDGNVRGSSAQRRCACKCIYTTCIKTRFMVRLNLEDPRATAVVGGIMVSGCPSHFHEGEMKIELNRFWWSWVTVTSQDTFLTRTQEFIRYLGQNFTQMSLRIRWWRDDILYPKGTRIIHVNVVRTSVYKIYLLNSFKVFTRYIS